MALRIIQLSQFILDNMSNEYTFLEFFQQFKKEILEIDDILEKEKFDEEVLQAYDDWGMNMFNSKALMKNVRENISGLITVLKK